VQEACVCELYSPEAGRQSLAQALDQGEDLEPPFRFDAPDAARHDFRSMILHFRPTARVGFISLLLGAFFVSPASGRTNRVNVIRVPTAGQPVRAKLGADGTIHLLLDSTAGPRYVKSQDNGRTFSEPIAITRLRKGPA
jgi:hypothetical protein